MVHKVQELTINIKEVHMADGIEAKALRAKEASRYLGIGKPTFYRAITEGRLPRGRRVTPRCVVWLRSELDAFLAAAGEQR
jgi:predicted DNA-binding transcriptional regulator AlpA